MRRLAIATGLFLCASIARADGEAPRVIRGSEESYSTSIMIADVSAALVIPATILPTWSSNPWIWSIPLSATPSVLTGMFFHIAHERYVAAVTSFLGWSSVVATSWFVGAEMSMAFGPHFCPVTLGGLDRKNVTCAQTPNSSAVGVGIGVAVGILGTAGMTILDGWMARSFKRTHVGPSVTLDAHGASAGLLGSF